MTRLSVTVTGPPLRICLRKSGITLPAEPRTLPKRTATYSVAERSLIICTIISHRRLDAPMTFVGLTALSVEMRIKRCVPK